MSKSVGYEAHMKSVENDKLCDVTRRKEDAGDDVNEIRKKGGRGAWVAQ